MIPKFKTYLEESVWGDLRKKSLGQEIRIEDDVDNMDMVSFYKYLKDKYDKDTFEIEYTQDGKNTQAHIWVEVIEDVMLSAYYNKHTGLITRVELRWFNCQIDDGILRELNKRYILQDEKSVTRKKHIFEKETPVENHTFISVLEFLIENKDSLLIEESVWGDIRKKSLGSEPRVEEDVDRMNFDEFYAYIESKYKNVTDKIDTSVCYGDAGHHICEVYPIKNQDVELMIYFYHDKPDHKKISFMWERVGIESDFLINLGKKFKIYYNDIAGYIDILVDDEKSYCSTYIKVLDYLLENKNNILIESVWADLRKKSLGKEERIEDDINSLSPKSMYDYLHKRYKSLTSNNEIGYTASGTTHYVRVHITKNCSVEVQYEVRKETVIKELKVWFASFRVSDAVKAMNQKMIEGLKKRYRTEEEAYVFIRPKTGKRTNRVVIDLIDYMLNNTEDKPIIEIR